MRLGDPRALSFQHIGVNSIVFRGEDLALVCECQAIFSPETVKD